MALYLLAAVYNAVFFALKLTSNLDFFNFFALSFSFLLFALAMIQESLVGLKDSYREDLLKIKKYLGKIEIDTSVLTKIAINREERREKR